jgi:hypothetical protein
MKSGAKLRGHVEFARKLQNIARKFPIQVGNALFEELDTVEKPESMARTPIQTGDLRDSHKTRGPVIRRNYIKCWIEVGGGRVDYAIRVHEDLEAFHPAGQAKFLESTLRESSPFILRRVANRVKFGI